MTKSKFRAEQTSFGTDGWIPDINAWAYSSLDSPTGVVSINADANQYLNKGSRLSYDQLQALTAYWTFESSSTPDVGSFTMGNISGTPPTYTAGKFGNALTFNGSNALSISDTATLKPTGEFTIGGWIKVTTSGAAKAIFQSYSANTAIQGILIYVGSGGKLNLNIGKGTGVTAFTDYNFMSSASLVDNGAWHYFVITYRNNWAWMYVDGVLENSMYTMAPAYPNTNYIRIGCQNSTGSDTNFNNGQIDDLFIINGYALDEQTIRDKYNAGTAQGTGNIIVHKKAIVTNIGAYSGGTTLVTFYSGTDYALTNSAISNPEYSNQSYPVGFPTNPDKWSISIRDSVNRSSSTNTTTFQNLGSISITAPIGSWRVFYSVAANTTKSTAVDQFPLVTLSTSNNSETDATMTIYGGVSTALSYSQVFKLSGKILNLSSKTVYYIITKSSVAVVDSINNYNSGSTLNITFESAYL